MAKTVQLTESELKNLIIESVKNILREGQNDNPSNTHYAIHKPTNKIVFSWDYSGYDPAELRQYKKDYFVNDVIEMGMDPKEIAIWTRRRCMNKGLDPSNDTNWGNYPMTESIINERTYWKPQRFTSQIDINLVDIMFSPEVDEFIGENWDNFPAEEVDVNLILINHPGDKGDYYNPPFEAETELIDTEVDPNGVFKSVFPAELYPIFVSDVDKHIDNNIEDVLEPFEYDEPEPDWDAIRDERRIRDLDL